MLLISKTKKERIKNELLDYIAQHEDEEFDYCGVSEQLNLSHKQLFRLLGEVHNEERIVFEQKHLRKPILLSVGDAKNLYWKVYIRSEKHPRSKLGKL